VAHDLQAATGHEVQYETLHGDRPSRAIVDFATGVGASLLFLTTHGRSGLDRLRLGSVASEIVRHATCPVVMHRPPTCRSDGRARPFAARGTGARRRGDPRRRLLSFVRDRGWEMTTDATASSGMAQTAHGEPFRFFDNREKYLMFVTTTSEKAMVSQRIGRELPLLEPVPPAMRMFDAGTGNGEVLANVLRTCTR
jgi:hypothetical protein